MELSDLDVFVAEVGVVLLCDVTSCVLDEAMEEPTESLPSPS